MMNKSLSIADSIRNAILDSMQVGLHDDSSHESTARKLIELQAKVDTLPDIYSTALTGISIAAGIFLVAYALWAGIQIFRFEKFDARMRTIDRKISGYNDWVGKMKELMTHSAEVQIRQLLLTASWHHSPRSFFEQLSSAASLIVYFRENANEANAGFSEILARWYSTVTDDPSRCTVFGYRSSLDRLIEASKQVNLSLGQQSMLAELTEVSDSLKSPPPSQTSDPRPPSDQD